MIVLKVFGWIILVIVGVPMIAFLGMLATLGVIEILERIH